LALRIDGLGKSKEKLLDQSAAPSTFSLVTVSRWTKLCQLNLV
jgi:hypothetical protein